MKFLVPLILIAASFGVFFFYTDKVYRAEEGISTKRQYISDLERQLKQTRDILKARAELSEKYKQIAGRDLENLKELLPDHVDNVKLVLDLNGIAKKNGMTLKSIKVDEEKPSKETGLGPDKRPYSQITLSFKVTAPYESFGTFLDDLERSLRLVDVTSISFKSSEDGVYDYDVSIKTYWLKKQ